MRNTSGRGIDISKAKIDLGKYAQLDEMKSELSLSMEIKTGFLGVLKLTITSRWLKEARVLPSDELSNLSSCLGSSEAAPDLSDDDDLEGIHARHLCPCSQLPFGTARNRRNPTRAISGQEMRSAGVGAGAAPALPSHPPPSV